MRYPPIPGDTGTVHDMTKVDYSFTPLDAGVYGHIASWSAWRRADKPRPGDQLILRNGERTSRYRVIEMDPCLNVDPPTMWMAMVVFDPRVPS